jgi:CheY-like chemotaxis protein
MQFVMSTSMGDASSDGLEEELHRSRLELSHILRLPKSESPHAPRSLVLGSNLQSRTSSANGKGATSSPHPSEHRREFVVDDILGPEEVVVRPLPPLLRRHPVLSGVTLSGAGEVVLLLNGPRLLKIAAESPASEPSTEHRSVRSSQSESSHATRSKVLVAEDSLSARRRLVEKLLPFGFDVTEASDGVEALNYARATTFDAVFSDLEMPGLNGFELLTAIKSDPRTPNKPVVIVTSRDEPETRNKAHELGADGFLSKPVSDASIEAMLEQLVIRPTT